MPTPTEPAHGTYARYVSKRFRCRCTKCRRAQRIYQERRKLDQLAGKPRTVLAIGSVRRIQALMASGWDGTYLAQHLGVTRSNLPVHIRYERVSAQLADRVRLLYDSLSLENGPSHRTRGRALAAGFLSPEWWDGANMDDPDALPTEPDPDDVVDDVAVDRAIRGVAVDLNTAERAEALRIMQRRGFNPTLIAERLHVSGSTINRLLQEAS